MKDIIDLGNKVFDRLLEAHGETTDARLLFLYGITVGNDWHIPGTNKVVHIAMDSVSKNFPDQVIDGLFETWRMTIATIDHDRNERALARMRSEYEFQVKPGDVYEFGKSSGQWREVGLSPTNFKF
jgi:hypothetical protein